MIDWIKFSLFDQNQNQTQSIESFKNNVKWYYYYSKSQSNPMFAQMSLWWLKQVWQNQIESNAPLIDESVLKAY